MYPDVTTASPGPLNKQVRLNRLSRDVCKLSLNCTTMMFVMVSPYCRKNVILFIIIVLIFIVIKQSETHSLCSTFWIALRPTNAENIHSATVSTEEASENPTLNLCFIYMSPTFQFTYRKIHSCKLCLRKVRLFSK